MTESTIRRTRQLAGAVALAVAVDVAWVKAPFLVIMAVPFALTAWRLRSARVPTRIAIVLFSALYALIGASYALSNGIHDGAGHNSSALINPGDFVGVYVGSAFAVWLAVHVVAHSLRRRAIVASATA